LHTLYWSPAEIFDGSVGYGTLKAARETIAEILSNYTELNYKGDNVPSLVNGSRSFIVTENGYFRAVPEGTQPGEFH